MPIYSQTLGVDIWYQKESLIHAYHTLTKKKEQQKSTRIERKQNIVFYSIEFGYSLQCLETVMHVHNKVTLGKMRLMIRS